MALIPLPQPQMRELPSAGSHLAACQSIIHLGTQPFEWEGNSGSRPQIRLGFELMDEFLSDGRPFLLSRTYSFSLHCNAALRADLEGWRGRPFTTDELRDFDLAGMIAATAVIGIMHATGRNGAEYANLASVLKPPLGTPPRYKLVNKPVVLSFLEFNAETYRSLPDWLQKKIAVAPEYKAVLRGGSITDERLGDRLRQTLAAPAPAAAFAPKGTAKLDSNLDDEIPF